MLHRRRRFVGLLTVLAALGVALATLAPAHAAPPPQAGTVPTAGAHDRQGAFAAAAREFGVPENVLLAVSYHLTRWESHAGTPSFAGGYGPMHLTHLDVAESLSGKGDDGAARDVRNVPSFHTLDAAAALLARSPDLLRSDPTQNIRGGAALLAHYARDAHGALPSSIAGWSSAVMRYSQASDPRTAARFAQDVYATMQQGASRTTDDGQSIVLTASVVPNAPTAPATASTTATPAVECPAEIAAQCEFIPAAYAQNSTTDPTNYGNYDLANRPTDLPDVRYIVIHDTEGSYSGTISSFQNPTYGSSTHYVVRSSDGHIAQMVETKNVAWHAGNWYVNGHAVGIEHEGYAIKGATWYTDAMYRSSAALVRYLAGKYNIPLDRAHIVGHDDVPGPTSSTQAGMHWDPGPFWDWARYMALLQAPSGSDARIVTLKVSPSSNTQTLKDCGSGSTGKTITQGVNFVYLRTAASATASYITNPYLTSDPLCANNWANKAVSGQSFYRFDTTVANWDGIYFGGQKAWFYNPGHNTFTVPGSGTLVKPAGSSVITVYGRAYPEAAAYTNTGITAQAVTPITNYSIPSGQVYVAVGPYKSDYFYAPQYTLTASANRDVQGATQYYQIFYNHRFAFVQAGDVTVVP